MVAELFVNFEKVFYYYRNYSIDLLQDLSNDHFT